MVSQAIGGTGGAMKDHTAAAAVALVSKIRDQIDKTINEISAMKATMLNAETLITQATLIELRDIINKALQSFES
jgi:hypothetical protein